MWVLLGWRELLVDAGAAVTIGSILVLFGAMFVAIGEKVAGTWLAVVSSAGLIGAGVGLRHTAVMVLGTIGLFFSTFGAIQQYVEGSTGVAVGLLVAGVLVLAVALVVGRFSRRSGADQ